MRKEVLFAIIAGISIGLVAAFGTWKISKMVKRTPAPIAKKETPSPKNITNLSIDNIKDFDVFVEKPTISGQVSPNTDIIISTSENDYYGKSDIDGTFSIEIELPAGLSEIIIFNPAVDNAEKRYQVIYSTEVEANSTSYVGTITDISSGTIQIKGDKGEIKQVSMNTDTSYINGLKKNIAIKQTDLAIGDYVVAMGKISGNKVLNTSRILVTTPLIENKISAKKITIDKLSKSNINDIKLPTKWYGPGTKELEVGQEIIIVGTTLEEKYTLRSIFKPVQ